MFFPRGFVFRVSLGSIGHGAVPIGAVHGSVLLRTGVNAEGWFVQIAYIQMLHMRDGGRWHIDGLLKKRGLC